MGVEQNDIGNEQGQFRAFRTNLGKGGLNGKTVDTLGPSELKPELIIGQAQSWSELDAALIGLGGLRGTSGYLPAAELTQRIAQIRQINHEHPLGEDAEVFRSLTRVGELREKVKKLIFLDNNRAKLKTSGQ